MGKNKFGSKNGSKKNGENKQELAIEFGKEWILILDKNYLLLNAEIVAVNLSGHANNLVRTQNNKQKSIRRSCFEVIYYC